MNSNDKPMERMKMSFAGERMAEWRYAKYWLEEDNLAVLTGLSVQCRTLDELAECIGLRSAGTLRNWRIQYPEIKNAIDMGRGIADASIVYSTFLDAIRNDGQSRKLWWQYRIGPKEEARVRDEQKEAERNEDDGGSQLVDALTNKASEVWANEDQEDE